MLLSSTISLAVEGKLNQCTISIPPSPQLIKIWPVSHFFGYKKICSNFRDLDTRLTFQNLLPCFFFAQTKKRHRSAQVLPFMNYKWKYYNQSPNMKWFHRPPQGASIKYNTKEDLYTAFPVIRKIIRPKGVHKVRIQ